MALLRRRSVFAAKVETTIGTAETLTAAEAVYNVRNLAIQPNITMDEREGQGGFNYIPSVAGMRSGTVTFSTEAYYDGSTIPAWATVLLPGCGFVNTAGVFSPVSQGPGSSVKTLTIGGYFDGMFRVLAGCMGTFTIDLPTGKMITFNWTFQGKWTNPTDATIIDPTYPTTIPMRMAAGSVSWDSVNICTSSVTVDAGNEVILRECAGEASGIKSALVVNRKPTISADPEMVLVATQNRHSQWLTPTTAALAITTGGSGENHLLITAPKAQLQNIQQGERSGLLTDELNWLATANDDPDEELTIEFVEAV
jgi:Phage tail tube protein